jgi:hypothetical protein
MQWQQVVLPYNPWDTGSSRVLMHNASDDSEVRFDQHVQLHVSQAWWSAGDEAAVGGDGR